MANEQCTCFLKCGVMAKDLSAKFVTAIGVSGLPCERFITIGGNLRIKGSYEQIRIIVADAIIPQCADGNAKIKQKVLGIGGATASILPDNRYRIRGLRRNWCTTTYILQIRLDNVESFRFPIQVQGVESLIRCESWRKNYDIQLERPIPTPVETTDPTEPSEPNPTEPSKTDTPEPSKPNPTEPSKTDTPEPPKPNPTEPSKSKDKTKSGKSGKKAQPSASSKVEPNLS